GIAPFDSAKKIFFSIYLAFSRDLPLPEPPCKCMILSRNCAAEELNFVKIVELSASENLSPDLFALPVHCPHFCDGHARCLLSQYAVQRHGSLSPGVRHRFYPGRAAAEFRHQC